MEGHALTDEKPMTRSEEKRAQIIDAASHLFMKYGYGSVSMDAIAADANVSKRTVYGHFSDKASLFIAVMNRHCAIIGGQRVLDDCNDGSVELNEDIAAGMEDRSPRPVLTAFCIRFLQILMSKDGVRLFRVVLSEAERFPELAQSFHEDGPKPLIRRLRTYLQEQSDKGILDIPDTERAAWRLIAMIKEPWHMRLSLGVGDVPSDDAIADHVEDTIGFFLKAYAPE